MNSNKKVILSIDNLKKYFVNRGFINKAVDGVSFDVHEGEIVGLIGESGSGKTTVGRTLLRLYDDFNGFVKLEDKIISGKKITNKLNRFLHKNIQMIFQDPHASLNSQQNIYSILKEPLLVNKIIKNKIKDIFSDWKEVNKAFQYHFQIEAMKLELDNLLEVNRLAEPLFKKWRNKFENFSFNENLELDDNFNAFFSYLDEKQQIESLIINNMYANTEKLMNFYYKKQKEYRNKELSKVDLDLIKNKKLYEEAKALAKYSKVALDAKKELIKVKKDFKNFLEEKKTFIKNANIILNNFIIESKNEKSLISISRLGTTDLDFYLYNLKNELLYKKRAKILKSFIRDIQFLNYEQIRELVSNLDKYIHDFYRNNLENIEYVSNIKKRIWTIIENEFDFSIDKYKQFSLDKFNSLKEEENLYLTKIENLKTLSNSTDQPFFDNEKLQEVKNNFLQAENNYQDNLNEYLKSFKVKIKKLYDNIQDAKMKYQELVDDQTFCNNKFEEIKTKYFEFANNFIKEKATDKRTAKTIINSYKSDLLVREETLKSFKIEKKYLNYDVNNIYMLLGVNNSWVKTNLSKLIENEDQNLYKNQTWKNVYSIYNSKLLKFWTKIKISNLLYKTTIYKSLEDVGLLKQFAYRYPHEFSGGQLQRIVIARALITDPKIIVADEPIASLDISIQAQVVNLLKDLCLKKNIGLIFIAHDLSMIEYIADNVQIMHLGKIVEHGKTENIYKKPYHPYTINLFKAIPKISNANEKFQNVSFNLDYLDEQQFPNVPTYHLVENQHYVYGTNKQVKKWVEEIQN
ncbi:ATP-binding cassette domain-containing protein [Mycoplasma sp. 744]|uniref:ATP-binding cassette domain-containing protein n=1 Tax=Mycoplasma sp. 744 TaxID=3108531 RepID=UPI002B1DC0C9|nr:ATP-binding cassette domain-containing protein [Mycoplasma sp. 744]MEA4115399.1 ATP-binding cassette domain-containing protein [Mycoplasma sp. 744]